MRIGWVSASIHAQTGYGRMSREITSRLLERHEVIAMGQEDQHNWGSDLSYRDPSTRRVVPILPIVDPKSSMDLIRHYCREYAIDLLVGHWDSWVLDQLVAAGPPVVFYVPIDAPLNRKWRDTMTGVRKVVAYSKFGLSELEKHLPLSQTAYIPHGVDCGVFRPMGEDKADVKKRLSQKLNLPIPADAFLMVTVQANVGARKQLPLLLKTFAAFAEKHEDAHLYLHTNVLMESPAGYDLPELVRQWGLKEKVHFPMFSPVVVPSSDLQLNELFNAADVYVTDSLGEGFGLPLLEAMASGLPAIAPANSSHVELVRDRGWLVDCVPPDVFVDFPLYVPTLQQFPVPNQRSMLEKMEEAYSDPKKRAGKGKAGREFALGYDWSKVMPRWFELLDEIQEQKELFADVRTSLEIAEARQQG